MNEERLTEIEIKLAYQEKTIKDLNDVICDQQKEIEKLGSICSVWI
ncbi:MAG: SlyX family protein [Proteobacteria bacterium]|nr:SlyX family protein [Pseudomonadota bacterium]MBU1585203.1 SlyX family protein [Pseudomonadota bacterium]MBU2454516.1 SlyX family protein [Pseudomonadota bacterium]MBU2629093.1 SlyX family protein [Pseudomonadota bacterium]